MLKNASSDYRASQQPKDLPTVLQPPAPSGVPDSFQFSVDLLADPALVFASDGTILKVNPGTVELFEADNADQLLGKSIFSTGEIVQGSTHDAVAKLQRGRRIYLEIDLVTFKGKQRRLEIVAMPLAASGAKVDWVLGVARDISERRRAERERALLAGIVQSVDEAIFSLSLDARVLTWNAAAVRLFGYTPEEAFGRPPAELLARAADREYASAEIFKGLETFSHHPVPNARCLEHILQRKDGTTFEGSFVVSGIYDANRQLAGLSVIVRDISEQKRDERDLAAIVNAAQDAIIRFSKDLKITSWNPAAEMLYGFTAREAIGRGFDLFVPPEELDAALEADRRLFATGEPVTFRQRAKKKDGTWFISLVNIFPIRDGAGNIIAGAGIGRDITDLIRLQHEQASLAAIVDGCEDTVISVDREGRITSWNRAAEKIFDHTADEARGHGLDFFLPPQALAPAIAAMKHVFETGEPVSLERRTPLKDGTWFDSLVNICPIRDGAGNISEVVGIGRDITRFKQIEAELRDAHEYTRGLIESSLDAMVMIDGELRITDGNEQLAKLTEMPKKLLFGVAFDSIFAGPEAAREAIQKTFAQGYVGNVDLVVRSASGKEIPISFNASLFYRAGKVIGIFGVARDVTRQRDIERTLRQEREYSGNLVQSSPDALLVCDSDLILTDANEQAVSLTGYPREELIGTSLPSLFCEPALAAESLQKTQQQGRVNDIELGLLTKTARHIPVSLNSSALRDSDATSLRIVAAVRDISERKRSERERSLLASIVDSSGNAIYSATTDLTLTSWNPAAERLLGYSAAEIVGHSAALLVPLDCRADALQHLRIVLNSGAPQNFETRRLHKDGRAIDVAVTQSPIRDGAGTIVGLSVTTRDISQRKRMEEELAQARDAALEAVRIKSEFLANMSHEIRTPLNSIIGMSDLLLDTGLNHDQSQYTNAIRQAGDVLLTLINEILDLSKITAGKLVFEEIDFDLTGAIEDATELIADQARRKGLELIASVDSDVPRLLRGDPGRLRQILLNLLSNAIKFTERGEVIVVVSKLGENPNEAMLRFEVRDTGIGIAKEKLTHLFEAFTQVDASTTRRYGGTGLGLSIAREMVAAMQGTISVSSTPGAGSTFWFTATFAKQTGTSRPAAERFGSLIGTKIIIVDDNADSRQILQRQVSAWGMHAKTATDAEEALTLMQSDTYQVALLDVMMPEVDGIQLARRIKADPALAQPAVIFVSSIGSRSDFNTRLAGLDIDGWLMKPVSEAVLYNAMVRALPHKPEIVANTAAAPGGETPAHTAAAAEFVLPEGRKLKVLLAEDNPINQKVAKLQLAKLGLDVDAVADGHEAVEAISRRPYDLILMDCEMPVMDGYDATREIRRREGPARRTMIVAMTANALPGDRDKCLAAGMDGYISKPVTQAALETALAELFAPKPPPQELSRIELVPPGKSEPPAGGSTTGGPTSEQ